jgi:hypothetical protein
MSNVYLIIGNDAIHLGTANTKSDATFMINDKISQMQYKSKCRNWTYDFDNNEHIGTCTRSGGKKSRKSRKSRRNRKSRKLRK